MNHTGIHCHQTVHLEFQVYHYYSLKWSNKRVWPLLFDEWWANPPVCLGLQRALGVVLQLPHLSQIWVSCKWNRSHEIDCFDTVVPGISWIMQRPLMTGGIPRSNWYTCWSISVLSRVRIMSAHPRLTRGTSPALTFLCSILTAFHKKPSRWTWASWILLKLCQCTKSSLSLILSLTGQPRSDGMVWKWKAGWFFNGCIGTRMH